MSRTSTLAASQSVRGVVYAGPCLHGQPVDVPLSDFRFRRNAKFRCAYDMGCWWEHELRVEDRMSAAPARRHPVCIGGSGACPPEDCGGPDGCHARREAAFGKRHNRAAVAVLRLRTRAEAAQKPGDVQPAAPSGQDQRRHAAPGRHDDWIRVVEFVTASVQIETCSDAAFESAGRKTRRLDLSCHFLRLHDQPLSDCAKRHVHAI